MKEITKMSRLTGQLEKLFNLLNADFFDGELDTPVITVQSCPRAYGYYTTYDAWNCKEQGRREINISAGTLDRPIECTLATLLHEMSHYYADTVLHVSDTSRSGTYHNTTFKSIAENHGLTVSRSDTYGWSHTEPSDELLEWILDHDLREIELCRNEYGSSAYIGGNHSSNGCLPKVRTTKTNNSRRYVCPKCGAIVRATREVNLICADCMERFIET